MKREAIAGMPTARPRVRPARYGPRRRAPIQPTTTPKTMPMSPAKITDHTAFHGIDVNGMVCQFSEETANA